MANKSVIKEYSLDRRFDFGEAKEKANPQKIVRFVKKRAHKRVRQMNKHEINKEEMDV
jgi:hypothetical protein